MFSIASIFKIRNLFNTATKAKKQVTNFDDNILLIVTDYSLSVAPWGILISNNENIFFISASHDRKSSYNNKIYHSHYFNGIARDESIMYLN